MRPSPPVVHVVDNLVVGGAQQLLVTWAREAARRGDRAVVVSLSDAPSPVQDRLVASGAEVLVVAPPRSGARGLLLTAVELRAVLRRLRPQVVQTHLTRAHVLGLAAARAAGLPTVATLHSTRVGEDGNSGRALQGERFALRRLADQVVACGVVVEAEHRERLRPRTAVVVPNATEPVPALDAQRRRLLRQEVAGGDDALLVLAVGRLDESKGYLDLLDAFARVARAVPDAVLAVAGTGPLEEVLRDRVAAPGLAGRVRLLGQRSDVHALLDAADLYVSASHAEGLPLALLEAMWAGLGVVATSVGDVPTVVDAASGVLVSPRDVDALAGALVDVLSSPALRRSAGVAARARAADVASVDAWYDRMRAVHRLAAARHR